MSGKKLKGYFALTKPTILLVVIITGAGGLVLEGSLLNDPWQFALVLILLSLAGGSASAFNQYFERDVDARMRRTRERRPLPTGVLSPNEALVFSILLGMLSVALFWVLYNPLSGLLALGTILFYGLLYTIILKPRTPMNIVIGGAAGSMGPVIAWAAAAGSLSIQPILLFAMVFFWTPAHFWSLAICYKKDYADAGLPMLPVIVGDAKTWVQIVIYAVLTLISSMLLNLTGTGAFYLIASVLLSGAFVIRAVKARRIATTAAAGKLFGFSILYMITLYFSIMIDQAVGWQLF